MKASLTCFAPERRRIAASHVDALSIIYLIRMTVSHRSSSPSRDAGPCPLPAGIVIEVFDHVTDGFQAVLVLGQKATRNSK